MSSSKKPDDDRKSRIVTFNSLNPNSGQASISSDDDEPQNFFVGGGKHSGLAVEDPNAQDIFSRIMRRFKTSSVPDDEVEEASFSNDPNIVLRLNGFSIEDGPLNDYQDPANQRLLELIMSGHAPLEAMNVEFGQRVNCNLIRNLSEDYKPPSKNPLKPFSGSGQRLGAVTSSSPKTETIPASTMQNISDIELDESLPTTQIQIRLSNGKKLVGKFNYTHTLKQIRQFIIKNAPEEKNFVLQTLYPVKVLCNEDEDVKSAGLLNTSITTKPI